MNSEIKEEGETVEKEEETVGDNTDRLTKSEDSEDNLTANGQQDTFTTQDSSQRQETDHSDLVDSAVKEQNPSDDSENHPTLTASDTKENSATNASDIEDNSKVADGNEGEVDTAVSEHFITPSNSFDQLSVPFKAVSLTEVLPDPSIAVSEKTKTSLPEPELDNPSSFAQDPSPSNSSATLKSSEASLKASNTAEAASSEAFVASATPENPQEASPKAPESSEASSSSLEEEEEVLSLEDDISPVILGVCKVSLVEQLQTARKITVKAKYLGKVYFFAFLHLFEL